MGEGSSLVGVKEDQTYSVRDLWRGVFLRSGNDAVHVLAAMNGGKDKTVREMNERAEKLRAGDTHVVSPDGYDEKGQVSSAYDLTLFARSGMLKADFREYAATARAQFPGEKKKGKKKRETYEIQNTNRLLTGDVGLEPYPGIAGVKNGSTTNAGATFTGVAQRGDRVLLVTCMHPDDGQGGLEVYKETAKLFDWGFKAAEQGRARRRAGRSERHRLLRQVRRPRGQEEGRGRGRGRGRGERRRRGLRRRGRRPRRHGRVPGGPGGRRVRGAPPLADAGPQPSSPSSFRPRRLRPRPGRSAELRGHLRRKEGRRRRSGLRRSEA